MTDMTWNKFFEMKTSHAKISHAYNFWGCKLVRRILKNIMDIFQLRPMYMIGKHTILEIVVQVVMSISQPYLRVAYWEESLWL